MSEELWYIGVGMLRLVSSGSLNEVLAKSGHPECSRSHSISLLSDIYRLSKLTTPCVVILHPQITTHQDQRRTPAP